jgi:hypothetical protein
MPTCPQCNKVLVELTRRCPSCQADLDLLVDYVSHLQGGLERAENLVRAGELAPAVWAYLEVLEVDPDNAAARRQVSQVAAAVRQFDSSAPGRRWLASMRPAGAWGSRTLSIVMAIALAGALLVAGFALGFLFGLDSSGEGSGGSAPAPAKSTRPANSATGD